MAGVRRGGGEASKGLTTMTLLGIQRTDVASPWVPHASGARLGARTAERGELNDPKAARYPCSRWLSRLAAAAAGLSPALLLAVPMQTLNKRLGRHGRGFEHVPSLPPVAGLLAELLAA